MNPSGVLAYIDPGSGTLIVQAIFAAAVGGLFSLGGILRRRFGWFRREATDRSTVD